MHPSNKTELRNRCPRSPLQHGWRAAGAVLLCACGGPPDGESVVGVSLDAVHALTPLDLVAHVVDLQPTADGRVWVLNSIAPYFILVGSDGDVERQFGEPGGGPAEFGAPVALVLGPDAADVWTYDVPRNALVRISAEGRRELLLPRDSLPPSALISFQGAGVRPAPPWLKSSRDGFLLARTRLSSSRFESALRLWNADLLLLRDNGPVLGMEMHTPIAEFLGDPASRYQSATTLLPYPLWTICADGTVGLYDPLANTLRRFTREGQELEPFVLQDERRVELTLDRVLGMFYRQLREDFPSGELPDTAEMRRQLADQLNQFVSQSATVFPEYVDLRCNRDGTLWLRPFDVTNGRLGQGSDWHRFSPDGSRTLIALPREFRTFRIDADRIWGIIRDSSGFESVAWVELDPLR